MATPAIMTAWWHDFKFTPRAIYVRATDTTVPINWNNVKSVFSHLTYYSIEKLYSLRRLGKISAFSVHCVPARPRAWYLLWAAAYRAGIDLNAPADKADALVYFEDQTLISARSETPQDSLPGLNRHCRDISKSHVARIFEDIFGYSLSVNPLTYDGPMAVKSEINGAHDGHIVQGPLSDPSAVKAGWVYQRLIDTVDGDMATDLRCPTVGGKSPLIYIKRRPKDQRFANFNTSCTLAKTNDHLSAEEQEKLFAFCAAMKLDWGGLDILRDKADGRIYIVDVNKTDMGPPLALPVVDKFLSVSILSENLTRWLDDNISSRHTDMDAQ